MRSRVLTTIFVAAISLCFATSASAFGGWWGSWPDQDEKPSIKLDKDWEWDWPDSSDSDGDSDWKWDWSDKDKGEWPDWEWPKDDHCWTCGPKDDGPRSAIPEPTAALLFAGGALVIASRRRRNR